jgi:hypothetical protein
MLLNTCSFRVIDRICFLCHVVSLEVSVTLIYKQFIQDKNRIAGESNLVAVKSA